MVALSHRREPSGALLHRRTSELAEDLTRNLGATGSKLAAASASVLASTAAAAVATSPALLPNASAQADVAANAIEQHHMRLSWRSPPDLRALVLQVVEDQPMWAVGLCLMLLGTFASALGMLCLKRAHGPAFVSIPWYRNSWFWGGIVLFAITAAGLDVVVFAITPLSLIAPFAGLTIVVSFVFAIVGCCGVRETPTKTSFVAVIFITVGVTICSIFGPKNNGTLEPAQLTVTFDQHPWLFVICIGGCVVFAVFTVLNLYFPTEVYSVREPALHAPSCTIAPPQHPATTDALLSARAPSRSSREAGAVHSRWPSLRRYLAR